MSKSIYFLIFISVLSISACTTPQSLQPLKKGQQQVLSDENFKPIFKDNFKSFVFKTKMLYGNKFEMGGMLVLKQTSEANYRTIFLTKFGLTLFDFEFGEQGFIVHKAFEQINKKMFLKVIENDMELLLTRHYKGAEALFFAKNQSESVVKTTINKKIHYFVQTDQQQLQEMHQGRSVSIYLSAYKQTIPHAIQIQHHNFPLSMDLTLLKH